jgi:hypothetical protein
VKRLILFLAAFVVLLLLGGSVASANAGRPLPKPPTEPGASVAAVAGGVGAVLAGFWIIRRPKP